MHQSRAMREPFSQCREVIDLALLTGLLHSLTQSGTVPSWPSAADVLLSVYCITVTTVQPSVQRRRSVTTMTLLSLKCNDVNVREFSYKESKRLAHLPRGTKHNYTLAGRKGREGWREGGRE